MDVGLFSPERLITDLEGACYAGKMARDEELTIAMTSGMFDLANTGHVRFLHEVSKLADLLFVGVRSDSTFVFSNDLPIVSEFDRAYMVAAIGCVDVVFIYDSTDFTIPLSLIKPDVYVKDGETFDLPILQSEKDAIDKFEITVKNIAIYPGSSTIAFIDRIKTLKTKWKTQWGPIQCLFGKAKTAPDA
jgi:D-beta-D-heptose 7-phosphate kinase/D-beta-D-heptose 1-phosphate adenosyltransferase